MMNLQPGPSHRFTLSQATSELLSRHSHLNLTDEVELVDSVIRGHGGFSDVYCGRFIRTGKYVAIKQLRVHIQKEQQLSKASIVFATRYVLNMSVEHLPRAPNMVFA
jgi:hypothetical protein